MWPAYCTIGDYHVRTRWPTPFELAYGDVRVMLEVHDRQGNSVISCGEHRVRSTTRGRTGFAAECEAVACDLASRAFLDGIAEMERRPGDALERMRCH